MNKTNMLLAALLLVIGLGACDNIPGNGPDVVQQHKLERIQQTIDSEYTLHLERIREAQAREEELADAKVQDEIIVEQARAQARVNQYLASSVSPNLAKYQKLTNAIPTPAPQMSQTTPSSMQMYSDGTSQAVYSGAAYCSDGHCYDSHGNPVQ